MRIRLPRVQTVVLVCVLTLAVSSPSSAYGVPWAVQGSRALTRSGPPVILHHDPAPSDVRIPPPRRVSALEIQTATITVNYVSSGSQDGHTCYPWPDDAKAAFDYAVGIWESLVTSPVPIVINACWADMEADVLGSSRATSIHKDFEYAPLSNTWYAAALANALHGSDLNETDEVDYDGDGDDADAEMNIAYNKAFDWYFGTDGSPAEYETDFASVVLHEICHGLGFAGSMTKSGSLGYWGWAWYSQPAGYDRFAEEGGGGSGIPLLSYGNGSETLGSALTGDDVFFDGPNARAANDGMPPKLYAPAQWIPGSSYSHLDYAMFNDTRDQLMVWQFSSGESAHHPGDIALGMLQDLGWSSVASPEGPKVTSVTPSSGFYTGTVHITDLAGSNFQPGATVKLIKAGGTDIDATSVTVVTSSTITGDLDLVNADMGWWDVVVTNPDSLSGTLPNGFRIKSPSNHDVYLPLMARKYAPSATILEETSEGSFPGSTWEVGDVDSASGSYYWGKRDCRESSGSFSIWSVGAGDATVSCGSDYPNNVDAWMIYGPFSLADATAAELSFDWWSETEYQVDDFFWGASSDGVNYYGTAVTGDFSSWTRDEVLDLGGWLGQDQLWIGFSFMSDSSVGHRGSFVDNILLRKYVDSGASIEWARLPQQRLLRPGQSLDTTALRSKR